MNKIHNTGNKFSDNLNWRLFVYAYVIPIVCIASALISIQVSRSERAQLVQEAIVKNCHSIEDLKTKIRATLNVSLENTNLAIAALVVSEDPKGERFSQLLKQKESLLNEIQRFKSGSCEIGKL